jgi:hypothetical protein
MHAPAQAVATPNDPPVSGLGPDLCHWHDRLGSPSLSLARLQVAESVYMSVAHGVLSVIVSGRRCGHWISLRPEPESVRVSSLQLEVEGQSTLVHPQLERPPTPVERT